RAQFQRQRLRPEVDLPGPAQLQVGCIQRDGAETPDARVESPDQAEAADLRLTLLGDLDTQRLQRSGCQLNQRRVAQGAVVPHSRGERAVERGGEVVQAMSLGLEPGLDI